MKVDLFDFDLPQELIAQKPVEPRDSARMLQVTANPEKSKTISTLISTTHLRKEVFLKDLSVSDLPNLLGEGDVMVVNDTKVIPARLFGKRGEGKIEATLHKQIAPDTWIAFCKPAKRFVVGETLNWSEDLSSLVIDRREGEVTLHFNLGGIELMNALERVGHLPLPPYIKRDGGSTEQDADSYQTLFADDAKQGAVAAPTASLHFTPKLLAAIEATGAKIARITLHVGAGTFLPVKADDTNDHQMHSEWWKIDQQAADLISDAKRVIAIGTTSLRTLESAATDEGKIDAGSGDTSIFITPGYKFKAVDCLLTNFHLPRSTLFMLVSAFSGLETMQSAYAHAIAEKYRFFSYGDCCFLER